MHQSVFASLSYRAVVLTALVVMVVVASQAAPDRCAASLPDCFACCEYSAMECIARGGTPDGYCHWEPGYCAGPLCFGG